MVGGILVDALSWPWIFYVNVPVGIAVFLAALKYVPESKDERAHKSFDLAGAVTVTSGLIILVYAIVKAQEKGWGSLHTLVVGGIAILLLAAFVFIERRSVEPLVRLSIFRVRTVRAANVAMFFVAAGLFAMFFFNTLYLQRVLEYWRSRRASPSSRSLQGSSSGRVSRRRSSRRSARASSRSPVWRWPSLGCCSSSASSPAGTT